MNLPWRGRETRRTYISFKGTACIIKRGGRAQRGAHAFVLGSKGDNSLAAEKGFFLHFVYQHMPLDSKYLI